MRQHARRNRKARGARVQTPAQPPVRRRSRRARPTAATASRLSKRSFFMITTSTTSRRVPPGCCSHGKYLAENRGKKMLIQGNCDERGSPKYNIALGQRRAEGSSACSC